MCFTFKKNNKQTKKPVNCFLQDDASAGIQSLQTSIEIKLCQTHGTDYNLFVWEALTRHVVMKSHPVYFYCEEFRSVPSLDLLAS